METAIWILVPLFALVGGYLIWYGGRIRRMMVAFAADRGMLYQRTDNGRLASLLASFQTESPGLTRSLDQIGDIVSAADGVQLFRAVELLDLSRHGQGASTHFSRLAATCEVSTDADVFLLISPALECSSRLGSPGVASSVVTRVRQALQGHAPRCPLSLTLRGGRALLYLEPLVTGSVRREDMDFLTAAARRIRTAFSDEAGT